jgi:hypothetical protein
VQSKKICGAKKESTLTESKTGGPGHNDGIHPHNNVDKH